MKRRVEAERSGEADVGTIEPESSTLRHPDPSGRAGTAGPRMDRARGGGPTRRERVVALAHRSYALTFVEFGGNC